jgi:hypothetical protein
MVHDEYPPGIIPDHLKYSGYSLLKVSEKYKIKLLDDYVQIDTAIISNTIKKTYCGFAIENERYETIDFKDSLKVALQLYYKGIYKPIVEYNYLNVEDIYASIYENDKFNPLFQVFLAPSIKDTFRINAYVMYKIFSTGPKLGRTKIILDNLQRTREQMIESGINYLGLVKGDTLCLNYITLKYIDQ